MANFHQLTADSISGKSVDFSSFQGKKVLVVNVASQCGLTPQYKQLQELYETFADKNFTIIGFPANDFAAQEPGTEAEIAQFCEINFGVTFPLMKKISVVGDGKHSVYRWLTQKVENGVEDAEVSWNFQKFMIDENGNYAGMVGPEENPLCERIVRWVEGN
ncbi:MAG: glutathione peroxidase [Bacteroidia bacterium]